MIRLVPLWKIISEGRLSGCEQSSRAHHKFRAKNPQVAQMQNESVNVIFVFVDCSLGSVMSCGLLP